MKNLFSLLALLCISASIALAQTTITGTLVGHDGKPMKKADVHLAKPNTSKALTSVEVASDGSFKLTTNGTGLLMLQCTGADHQMYEVPLFIEKPTSIALNVKLQGYRYNDDFSNVKIIGDFNDFTFGSGESMEKQPDGTYIAEFETNAPVFAYQLLGVAEGGRSINGTQSDGYVYDGGGDYRSMMNTANGGVKIVFDPKKLARSNTMAEARFNDPNSTVAKFSDVFGKMLARRDAYQNAAMEFKASGRDMKEFTYDWSADLSSLSKSIAAERDPMLRQALLFSYLDMRAKEKDKDPKIAQQAMKEIPTTSPFWSISPSVAASMVELAGVKDQSYLEQMIEKHPDANVKASMLYDLLSDAEYNKQPEKARKYYKILTENYPDHVYAKLAKDQFAPDRKVMVGKMVPAFSFASLTDPNITYTNESMKGKIYLIDFWATWCGPCLRELENLHKAYEKFAPQGFQILSLSFDAGPEDVVKFREGKWKMPWLHTFITGGFKSDAAKSFEVSGIPKPVLVDGTGKIIATEVDLRGEELDKTLTKVFGDKTMGAK